APVADAHETRLPVEGTEPEVLEHTRDVLDAARVLDVEDDGAHHRRRTRRAYHTGTTKRLSQVELTRPPTITSAIGCSTSPQARGTFTMVRAASRVEPKSTTSRTKMPRSASAPRPTRRVRAAAAAAYSPPTSA